ncbi:DUF3486 family protein [Photobacterium sanguinicancri]|uniref:DUF3486 family protein n=1 Tax=Photobacterium sanguinicancri TaxID=875932 RepID=A0AAW7Y3Y9_9GAMM|nr:DUF3486 family protein [Photobacterium sanguinicancri]MDO6542805.1 DUF3486 family protein [Photobacterium sanguinicancri]
MMTDKTDNPTRGRRSKIDLLPDDVKQLLDGLLRDGKNSQQEVLQAVNEYIEQQGLPEDLKPSRSGLNRYSSRMEAIGKDLRDVREVSQALVAQLGDKPTGEVSKLILEIGRTQLFKAMMNANEQEGEVDIGMIKDAMLAAQRLESAAMSSHKREKEIRKAFADEAAKVAETVAKKAGMTAETVSNIKKEILGIA